MTHDNRTWEKQLKARRASAMARGELRQATTPRAFPSGPTSMAVKVHDTAMKDLIDRALAERGVKP